MTKRIPPEVIGEYVDFEGEQYYRITNSHLMPDFFMSVVGASDHWMFISSNGALTAGRRNADQALFPYASDDKISAARGETGCITLLRVMPPEQDAINGPLWEPFGVHDAATRRIRRNLYKTPLGNKLVFEEINEALELTFRYRWTFSEKFGFVRSCRLTNTAEKPCSLELLDGVRNILPYGISNEFQMRFSNLGNAYKKNELISGSDLGVFYLSSVPTDRAEASEGLRATTIWQTGLVPTFTLLSADQLRCFRAGKTLQTEADVRGKAGAYLLNQGIELGPGENLEWHIVAELAQDHSAVIGLDDWLQRTSVPAAKLADDIQAGEHKLLHIVSTSDAVQFGSNRRRTNRHLSNTVFNAMRGGLPLENYRVPTEDFSEHVTNFNRQLYQKHESFLTDLPSVQNLAELRDAVAKLNDPDLTRLGMEYLPFAFSRRHGDPTRPWNHFSIDLYAANGRTNLNYQGNWRDIFQNWEAVGLSFPEFITSMICRFVNATTADGYNPYRVSKDGFEWEEPLPGDPWANIGYWGDHQIIYLLKLMEWSRRFHPERLGRLLNSPAFVHANVPYRIKDYEQIRQDVRDTIVFDSKLSATINERVARLGADGKLLRNQQDQIQYVTLMEKLLTLSLAKLSNFVPNGGIWLNTQRPEWNDANNALVGNGLSMVTACYLHRWFKFLHDWVSDSADESFAVSQEVAVFFRRINGILQADTGSLYGDTTSDHRIKMVEGLSKSGSEYRTGLYADSLSGQKTVLARQECLELFQAARRHIETTIRNNKRPDGLYHTYNLLNWRDGGVKVEHLYEMLEGQVAALSSGLLTATESVQLLGALRDSALYRRNQDSYLLYPDRQLPRFLDKNQLGSEDVNASPLLQTLLEEGDESIVTRDVRGGVHFNGGFRNSADLQSALDSLGPEYQAVVQSCGAELCGTFDEIFGHRQFTGRSGTFFAYEGLGSIYWHMVSKLCLAVSETYFCALRQGASQSTIDSLRSHYEAIRRGIGSEKSPLKYGGFPSDSYSHTPENAGVKQPGMTGQVKEDILARFSEIGIHIDNGCVCFRLELFDRRELVNEASTFNFFDLAGEYRTIQVPENGFGFTLFQVPFIYQSGNEDTICIRFADGSQRAFDGCRIDQVVSRQLFSRSGAITAVECRFASLCN